jgi:hypothetical protein
MKTLSLQLHYDDYLAICQAVEAMQNIEPGISVPNAVALIARDFMSSVPSQETSNPKDTFVEMMKKYEQFSSLKLIVIDPEEKAILHGVENLALIAEEVSADHESGEGEVREEEALSDQVATIDEDELFA